MKTHAFDALPIALAGRLFLAAQLMSIISMSYGFFAYAAQLFCDKLARRGCMHAQLLLCMFMHFCWEVLAITSFVATRSLGFWRWSCLPVLFFIGFQQLAPSLRAVSSAVGWGSYLCALLAMSPLACLAAAIDGPLLGFASMYSRGKGFTVGALDRAVAGDYATLHSAQHTPHFCTAQFFHCLCMEASCCVLCVHGLCRWSSLR